MRKVVRKKVYIVTSLRWLGIKKKYTVCITNHRHIAMNYKLNKSKHEKITIKYREKVVLNHDF